MERTEIYIYGASGHGKVIADIVHCCGYTLAGWIDDIPDTDALEWNEFRSLHSTGAIAIGIGDNSARERIMEKVSEAGYQLPSLIHPSAVISASATIGEGSVIMPLAIVNADALIGRGCIINSGAVVEHNCILEDYVHISPNATLAGGVHIKHHTHIGIGAAVIQKITVGTGCIIAAGSAVIRDIPDDSMAAGVPAAVRKTVQKAI